MKIDSKDPSYNVAVGLGDEDFELIDNFIGYTTEKGTPTWSYASSGVMRVDSEIITREVSKYSTNDIITFVLNTKNGNIQFFKNTTLQREFRIKLHTEKIYPTCTLYGKRDQMSINRNIIIDFWKYIFPLCK